MASVASETQTIVEGIQVTEGRFSLLNWLGLLILAVFILMALFPHLFTAYDPLEQNVRVRLQGPSSEHIFGTDEIGRDIYSRVVYGTRTSVFTSVVAVLVSVGFGVPAGLLSGYAGGKLDEVISRATDLLIAFPGLLVAMTMVAITGQNLIAVAIVIGIVMTPIFVRITRAITLKVRGLPYVDAVRSAGAPHLYIMFRTVLPNCASAIYVQILLVASRAIVIEAGLSFLGLGVPPPSPSWGAMLSKSRSYFHQTPTFGIFPGIFLALLVIALQLSSGYLKRKAENTQ